jgi:hypothetical protein
MKSTKFKQAIKALHGAETFNKDKVNDVKNLLTLCSIKRDENHYEFDDESVIYIEEKKPGNFIVVDLSEFFP